MAKKKLHAGTGAEASILTRFIKPKQPLPLGNKDHRSDIILDDKFEISLINLILILDKLLRGVVQQVRVSHKKALKYCTVILGRKRFIAPF